MPTTLEAEATRLRDELLALDRHAQADLLRAFLVAQHRLDGNLHDLLDRIAAAERAGQEVRPGWLFAQQRFDRLIADHEQQLARYVLDAYRVVNRASVGAAQMAVDHAGPLAIASAGPAPQPAQDLIARAFDRIHVSAFERAVRYSRTGQALGQLFAQIAHDGVTSLRDTLAYGVAVGRPIRLIAHDVAEAGSVPLERAMGIARTEVLRSYRAASTEAYVQSHVVTGWRWLALLDWRTCPICMSMNGSLHPADEVMATHPLCRCTQVPVVRSWDSMGFSGVPELQAADRIPTGDQLLATLSREEKLKILGPGRLQALEAGTIRLQDLARRTDNPVWGPGLRLATLRELGVTA